MTGQALMPRSCFLALDYQPVFSGQVEFRENPTPRRPALPRNLRMRIMANNKLIYLVKLARPTAFEPMTPRFIADLPDLE
jgi:hypothetical protein